MIRRTAPPPRGTIPGRGRPARVMRADMRAGRPRSQGRLFRASGLTGNEEVRLEAGLLTGVDVVIPVRLPLLIRDGETVGAARGQRLDEGRRQVDLQPA